MRVCAAGVLVKDGRILLGRRRPDLDLYPDVWDVVGRHCRSGETPEQALRRELNEELGIVPVVFSRVAVLNEPEPLTRGDGRYHVYLVSEWTGTPWNRAPDEHSEIAWFTVPEATELKLALPGYPAVFRDIENRACESGRTG